MPNFRTKIMYCSRFGIY